jgi:hypothetical protein
MAAPCPDLPALRDALTVTDLIEYLKTLPPRTLICTGQNNSKWLPPFVLKREHLRLHETASWDPNTGQVFSDPEEVLSEESCGGDPTRLLPATLLEIELTTEQ